MSESGHSQPGMYGQGRRRRRRRGDRDAGPPGQNLSGPSRDREYQQRERRDGSEDSPGPLIRKTPIILAKPPGERAKPSPVSGAPVLEKPIMLMKARDDGGKPGTPPEAAAQSSGPGPSKMEREGQRPTQPVYQIQNRGMGASASSSAVDPMVGQSKLLPPEKMKHSIKLVDDQMNWCDSAMEYLRDQTDMLVVGVIGLQGTGKSTIMSLLSANTPEEDQRNYVFRAQTQEIKERGGNQSTGIDFFITQERVIFLDTQPMLSPSILDHLINNDRKLPPEYNLPHTYIEMQSLQIAAFLFTVCHAVIVVQDWFTDINLYRFLQTAEMLKPSTPSASHDSTGSSGSDDGAEYYPHIVFVQNKARWEDFCPRNLKNMHMVVDKLMAHSHLKYKVETLRCYECVPGLSRTCSNKTKECPLGGQQCAAMRVFIYGGGSKFADFSVKTCALVEECVEGSVNFGDARTVITSKCCTSDLCNTQPAPDARKSKPNGKKCFSCEEDKCTTTLNCEGNENYCISTTVTEERKTMTMKGCASNIICSSTQTAQMTGAVGTEMSCCQGDFCNSASSASVGLQLLVVLLMTLIWFS
ncbi:protein SMG9 isoform X2 [Parambassis ranga]|nr:protein SMG9 isoform X2 [Parambassis ranga]XP_028280802.1 protein SMG9 isoform X2 [Parambassis ranga]